jgi:hypothetical protein
VLKDSESFLGSHFVGAAFNRLGEHNSSPMPRRKPPQAEELTRGVITRLLALNGRLWKQTLEYLPSGAVAHRLEHPSYTRLAAGSIPACPTTHIHDLHSNLGNIPGSSNPAGHLALDQITLVRTQAPEPSGCSSVSRVPHLECGGRWGGTSHPDHLNQAVVAQSDRAPDSESGGQPFESAQWHQLQ